MDLSMLDGATNDDGDLRDLHMVGYKANVDNLRYVHHVLVKSCDSIGSNEHMTQSEGISCIGSEAERLGCGAALAGWAPGGWSDAPNGVFSFPDEAGMPIIKRGTRYILIETHYTNINGDEGEFDATGFELYATENLRQYDAGSTLIGPIAGNARFGWGGAIIGWTPIRVEPRHEAWGIQSECEIDEDTNIFATRAHGHLLMESAYMKQKRPTGASHCTCVFLHLSSVRLAIASVCTSCHQRD